MPSPGLGAETQGVTQEKHLHAYTGTRVLSVNGRLSS